MVLLQLMALNIMMPGPQVLPLSHSRQLIHLLWLKLSLPLLLLLHHLHPLLLLALLLLCLPQPLLLDLLAPSLAVNFYLNVLIGWSAQAPIPMQQPIAH